jgi:predicted nuclease of restriction endonuclease-like RecB superfamily
MKNELKTLMYNLSDEEFYQILDIFFSIDTTFYEAFKRIITNQETKNDHDIFKAIVYTFRPDLNVYVYTPAVYIHEP